MSGVVGEQTAKPSSFVSRLLVLAGPAVRGGNPVQNKPFSALNPNQHDHATGLQAEKNGVPPHWDTPLVRPQTHDSPPGRSWVAIRQKPDRRPSC